ncbi:hypothetical protein QGN29_13680 [Temperatibacter marinus]|uniref:Uncharacterized protein n=1 Tax=Temperatibacter marinus TaxID=1456591 RepID=A0AA52EC13_9PROT|nr:hypothetical protein [Temperatibacter marinus]WND02597.1 hypothetical protein QGN29_13680 [Temperatibacter marinus]
MEFPTSKTDPSPHTAVDDQQAGMTEDQASRRRLLALGAAGLPMMLTMKAGASSNIISQLDCLFSIPANFTMLVRNNGKVWMGDSITVNWQGQMITNSIIRDIKDQSDIILGRNSAPSNFRPTIADCPSVPNTSKGKGDDEPVIDRKDRCERFKIYETSGGPINITNILDENGNWSIPNNANGLYLHLMKAYADEFGNDGGLPGISCIHSALLFHGQL